MDRVNLRKLEIGTSFEVSVLGGAFILKNVNGTHFEIMHRSTVGKGSELEQALTDNSRLDSEVRGLQSKLRECESVFYELRTALGISLDDISRRDSWGG